MAKPTRLAANNEPVLIFQDDFVNHPTTSISRAPMPSVAKPVSPRRALSSTDANAMFQQPNGFSAKQPGSPLKTAGLTRSSPLTPLRKSQSNKLNPVSMFPPGETIQGSTDSLPKKQPPMSRFKTVAQKPSMESTMHFGKENIQPTLYPAPPAFNVNLENFYPKPPGKRSLMEAAPIKDSRPLKKAKVEDGASVFETIPMLADDGSKPNHSYAQLIGMAILRAPQRRLTLAQIYKWISDSYSFYKADDAGWQNSIRHNLSLNKAFIKQERPKDDPGKGNYWAVEPGMEQQFTKEKTTKKAASGAENVPVMSISTRLEPAHVDHTIYQAGLPSLPPVLPLQPVQPQNGLPLPAAPLPAPEVSSDATIPMSDNISPEEHKQQEQDLPNENAYSPLPTMMHSSPPMLRHMEPRSNTPPPPTRGPTSSQARKHKRKYASMDASLDDSGYISSLDSSVMRSNQAGRLLTSEADRPRSKRSRAAGRAEEEIARLRASSYESPSRGRSHGGAPLSSSPLRQQNDGAGQMLPPLTPAVKFKVPSKPPASVSPNTNLRIHRDKVNHMLNSPLRRVSNMSEDIPWSPAFRLDESLFSVNDFMVDPVDFDIFDDNTFDTFFSAVDASGSPVKRSTKRARIERTISADALGEITRSAPNKAITSVPFLKAPSPPFSLDFETPSKAFEGLSSPMKAFLQSPTAAKAAPPAKGQWNGLEDICTQLFEDDPDDGAVDILQGFEKIGSNQYAAGPSSKPSLGRSHTSTF
ncbi:fork head domain-domain-containing protein [Microdochium bolleyi]|uniref:Fork head domain-domain-containing protein n=1 Tax=Microdochium bolleyi TaxID=196109 RepID=A0A136JAL1_9PEZI|nr:fork head domain-domain-containing protein [Microdochium bolleyi]